jgi:hypothetical protein
MKSCVCPVGRMRTVWASHTFWRSVWGMTSYERRGTSDE